MQKHVKHSLADQHSREQQKDDLGVGWLVGFIVGILFGCLAAGDYYQDLVEAMEIAHDKEIATLEDEKADLRRLCLYGDDDGPR